MPDTDERLDNRSWVTPVMGVLLFLTLLWSTNALIEAEIPRLSDKILWGDKILWIVLSRLGSVAGSLAAAVLLYRRGWVQTMMIGEFSFLLFRLVLFLLVPVIAFLGGSLMGITLGILLSAALSSALAMAMFEFRALTDLGLHWREGTRNNLLIGTGLGLFSAALVVLAPVGLGMASFAPLANPDLSWRGALFLPILLFCGAMGEELAFRGFALQYLTRGWGPWAALLSTGALFGIMHDGNPGATWLSGVNTAAFGILFGFALLRSRDLWFPIGMHFGWNVALPFLGVELSGLTIRVTGYQLVWKSSDLWSGGKYGPEAGLLASAIIAILFVAVWKVPISRGNAWLLDAPEGSESPELPQSALPPS